MLLKPASWARSIAWPLAVLLIGISSTAFLVSELAAENERTAREALTEVGEKSAAELQDRVQRYQYGLRGIRGAAITAGEFGLSREAFHRYSMSRDLAVEFPGARGMGFVRRVPPAQEAAFVKAAQLDGAPNFMVHAFRPHEGERYVIQYFEPEQTNSQAIGLDIASESRRRQAADAAMRAGVAQLSAPITLVQADGAINQSFLLLLPIYRTEVTPPTEAERVAAGYGWSYAALSMAEVLGNMNLPAHALHAELRDVTSPSEPLMFYQSSKQARESAPTYVYTARQEVMGRSWEWTLQAYPAFNTALNLTPPSTVALIGGFATLTGAALALAWGTVRQRKQQLLQAQANLGAIVESSDDGIIGKQLDGVVTSWNAGAARIFGYDAKEAIGRPLVELVVPETRKSEETEILRRISNGDHVQHFETQRQRKDGSLIDVSVTVSPIYNDAGKIVGASKTVRDISRQKEAERQVRQLNERLEEQVTQRTFELESARRALRTVLDAVPSMIGYWDKNLINRVANHAYHRGFGVAPGSLPGTSMRQLLGDKLFEANRIHVEAALRGEPQSFERTIPSPSRGSRHSLAHYLPDIVDGEVQGFYVVVHNVTDLVESRLKLTAALHENEVLLSTINQQMLFSVTDRDGRITEVNDRFCEAHGYSRHELVGQRHDLLASGVHSAAFWQTVWERLTGGHAWHGEICNRSKDGSLLWFDSVFAPLASGEGMPDRFIALRIDITSRKAANAEVDRLNVLLRSVLRAASEVAIIATGVDGRITLFNAGAERLLGYAEDEVLATPAARFHLRDEVNARAAELSALHADRIEGTRALVHISEVEGAEKRDWTYVRKDGRHLPVTLAMTTIRNDVGTIVGYLGMATDITERKEFEASLIEAKRHAEQASQAKGQFLANMSHEIRTPLNAVLGMLQLTGMTPLNSRQRDYVNKAQGAAKLLLGLLNDILDFSKMEAGKLQLDPHPFELEGLMRDLAVMLSGSRNDSDVEVVFEMDPRLPAAVVGDRMRLQQILINLAGNAQKFTEHGQVVISLVQQASSQGQVTLRVAVTDTGIGIRPEQLARIFEGFTQAEASTTRRFGGTGLGLVICKRLVTLMGGELTVHSDFGKGSSFSFDLTLPVAAAAPVGCSATDLLPGLRILVVDDNPLVGEIFVRTLELNDWEVDCESSGHAGVDRARRAFEQGRPYDVILMDWRMPGLDGLGAASLITQQMKKDDCPLIIMVTAFGRETLSDVAQQGEPPFVDFLSKPVTPQQLVDSVRAALAVKCGQAKPAAFEPVSARRLAGLRLLLVEDNALNRQIAFELLREEGAELALAEGGLQGVAMALEEGANFDVIIMDVQMPDIDGLEAARRIRAHVRGQSLPILAMTANASVSDRMDCLAAGMNDHVGKPIDMDEVVPRLLSLAGRRPVVVLPAPADLPSTSSVDDVDALVVLMKRFGQKTDIYRKALNGYKPEGDRLLDELAWQVNAAELAGAGATMHALKGLAATVGARKLAAVASDLEQQVRKNRHAEVSSVFPPATLARLEQLLTASDAALRAALSASQPEPASQQASTPALETASPAQLLARLSEIKMLLLAGNLRAVDLVEELLQHLSSDDQTSLQDVIARTRDLQFPAAAQAVQRFLES